MEEIQGGAIISNMCPLGSIVTLYCWLVMTFFICLLTSLSKGMTFFRVIKFFPLFFIFSLLCCPIQITFNCYFLNAFTLSAQSFCISLAMMPKMKRSKHLVIEHAASVTDGCDCWQPSSLMKHWYQIVRNSIFNSNMGLNALGLCTCWSIV